MTRLSHVSMRNQGYHNPLPYASTKGVNTLRVSETLGWVKSQDLKNRDFSKKNRFGSGRWSRIETPLGGSAPFGNVGRIAPTAKVTETSASSDGEIRYILRETPPLAQAHGALQTEVRLLHHAGLSEPRPKGVGENLVGAGDQMLGERSVRTSRY